MNLAIDIPGAPPLVFMQDSMAGNGQRIPLRSRTPDGHTLASGERQSDGWRPVSIVLVEDNAADVVLVREALEENGVTGELVVLTDGEKAIRFIDGLEARGDACLDLFIVDLNLPRKPGREVLRHIRACRACRETTVVVLSSSDSQRDRDEAASLGADRYIRKPSRLEEFLRLGATFRTMIAEKG